MKTDPLLMISRESEGDRHSSLGDTGEVLAVEGTGVYGQVQRNGVNGQLSNDTTVQKTLICPRINEGSIEP